MAFTFWPDSTEAQALTNLRRELHELRRSMLWAAHYLRITPQTVCWRVDASFALDVMGFSQALERARVGDTLQEQRVCLEQASHLYPEDLLCTLDDDWLEPHRHVLHDRAVKALEALSSLLERQGETGPALLHAQHLQRLEPLRESVHARMMHLQLAQGNRAAALRIYEQCTRLLRTEWCTRVHPLTRTTANSSTC